MLDLEIDSSGNRYIEVDMVGNNEAIRLSIINDGWNGGPCIRMNIREENGRVRNPGPEFPIENLDEIMQALYILQDQAG